MNWKRKDTLSTKNCLINEGYMEYVITILDGDKRKVVSRHTTLQEALEAGEIVWTNAPKGVTVSCVVGTFNEAGELDGKYQLYKSWF